MTSFPTIRPTLVSLALLLAVVVSSCSLIQTPTRSQSQPQSAAAAVADIQLRITQIDLAVYALDSLVMQPAPDSLTPKQLQTWDAQTEWLTDVKNSLLVRRDSLQRSMESAAMHAAEQTALSLFSGRSSSGRVASGDDEAISKPSEPAEGEVPGSRSNVRRSPESAEEILSGAQAREHDFDGLGGAGKDRQQAAMSIIQNIR